MLSGVAFCRLVGLVLLQGESDITDFVTRYSRGLLARYSVSRLNVETVLWVETSDNKTLSACVAFYLFSPSIWMARYLGSPGSGKLEFFILESALYLIQKYAFS